jgi:hypothetical protein
MKITREELEVVAKECGFDLTFRLEKFARLVIEAMETNKSTQIECVSAAEPTRLTGTGVHPGSIFVETDKFA